jgi:hypothetical protein
VRPHRIQPHNTVVAVAVSIAITITITITIAIASPRHRLTSPPPDYLGETQSTV